MRKFLTKKIELQDKKIWKNITIGIIYFCTTILFLHVGRYFLILPLYLAKEYNISISEINSLYGNNYIFGIMGIMIISILVLPVYIALNKIKKRRKRRIRILFRW